MIKIEIVTRAHAKANGLKRYFSGKPCCRGHICERRICSGNCVKCAAIFSEKWVKENPERRRQNKKSSYYRRRGEISEKVHESNRRYYLKNAKKICQREKERSKKIIDMIAVLKIEMPDLLKEFGL